MNDSTGTWLDVVAVDDCSLEESVSSPPLKEETSSKHGQPTFSGRDREYEGTAELSHTKKLGMTVCNEKKGTTPMSFSVTLDMSMFRVSSVNPTTSS